MPAPLHTQTAIAVVWDVDQTLIASNTLDPVLAEYGVDPDVFWAEVAGLVDHYARGNITVDRDVVYLTHLLTYVREGVFKDLTNDKLYDLGARLEPVPGMPEFMAASRDRINEIAEFAEHGITVEHHVVSSGPSRIIEGSVFGDQVDGVWASTFIEEPASPGYLDQLPGIAGSVPISQIGSAMGGASKARAIFEINKGINQASDIDVNTRMSEDQRRVPLRNMIYVAHDPSDIPVLSILNSAGGRTLGVYIREPQDNHATVKNLQDQGRIQGIAEADFREDQPAYNWLMDGLEQIGHEIVEARHQAHSSRVPRV